MLMGIMSLDGCCDIKGDETMAKILCVLYDERPLRPDRLSAAIEQRLVAHQVAIRHQDERHI